MTMLQIHRLRLTRLSAAAAAVGALAAGGVLALGPSSYAGTGPASATSPSSQKVPSYTFTALDDNANDPTFNQLLGINVQRRDSRLLRLRRYRPSQQGLHLGQPALRAGQLHQRGLPRSRSRHK